MAETNRKYHTDVRSRYTDFEAHYNTSRRFGHFSEDGKTYTVTDPDTPRQWMNMLYNDKFASVVSNRGEGYTVFGGFHTRITRYYNPEFYMVRDVDGKRVLEITDLETGENFQVFEPHDMICNVMPGCSEFVGTCDKIAYRVRIFVPQDANCECWLLTLTNTDHRERRLSVHAQQVWAFMNCLNGFGSKIPCETLSVTQTENGYAAVAENTGKPFDTLYGAFGMEGFTHGYYEKKKEKILCSRRENPPLYKDFLYTYVNLYSEVVLPAGASASRTVVCAASDNREATAACAVAYADSRVSAEACDTVLRELDREFSINTCELPDKNMERFLNTWLKYQIGLIYRFNRNTQNAGFRDLLQDAWGAMLIRADYSKPRLIEALSHLYSDGHSMRGYDSNAGVVNPRDFVDCPLWAPNSVAQYLKETGDYDFLNQKLPWFDREEGDTVEQHLWKVVDLPWNKRGANGLVLMRDGDWLDGLAGINQNGTATSAWATMQAYWAQSCMAEIYDAIGDSEKAAVMRARNLEYKKAVREVAWDGKWYVYGFKSDGFPVGSSRCREGKIYLNPQMWAIFTGIEDDPARIASICRSVSTYLSTPFGPLLLYPPYINDTTCGVLSTQVPGTFANAAIYLHGGTFKVYSDIVCGNYDEAYDTYMRLLPNHPDNSDSRRTSEPYCTGNVHFGPDSPRFGMNLFSWFTATPDWLIHGGFGRILGVEAGFGGLHAEPHVPQDWDAYTVKRQYRGKNYTLCFRRAAAGERKGIYRDDRFISENVIPLGEPAGTYHVLY